jgi:hypothetical protein
VRRDSPASGYRVTRPQWINKRWVNLSVRTG